MTTFLPERHYPKAPITEAVIDLIAQPGDAASSTLEAIQEEGYPSKEPVVFNHVQVNGAVATTTREQVGWRFRSGDGLHIYQVRKNGFGMSRLAPYDRWESFSGEARRLWEKYRASAKPAAIQRMALRYINRIDIPLPLNDFGEYFMTAPLVSPHLPQGLSHYLSNLTIPMDEIVTAVITQAILNQDVLMNQPTAMQVKPDTVSMLLDIDVSQILELPTTDEGIWERFEYLRKVKNHVFESCITDKARELFQ